MGLPWVTRGRQKRKQLKGHDNPYDGVLRDLINFIFVYAVVLIQKQTFSNRYLTLGVEQNINWQYIVIFPHAM